MKVEMSSSFYDSELVHMFVLYMCFISDQVILNANGVAAHEYYDYV